MPLHIPKGISEEEHRFLYETFLGKEAPKNKFVRGVKEFFSFHWKGRTSQVRQLTAEGAENRQVFIECLRQNPRWIRKDLSLGIKLFKHLREDDGDASVALKNIIKTAYKTGAVFEWSKSHKETRAVRECLKAQPDISLFKTKFSAALDTNDQRMITLLAPILENTVVNGRTPLVYAIETENWRLFKELLKSETIDVNMIVARMMHNSDAFRSLNRHYNRTADARFIKYFLAQKGDRIHYSFLPTLYLICRDAARNDDIELMKELINHGVNVSLAPDQYGDREYPLHYAVMNGSIEMVKLLLKQPDMDVDAPGWHELRPITYAQLLNHSEIADLIQEHSTYKPDIKTFEQDLLVNREFLSNLQVEIPDPPEGVDISEILELFDECLEKGVQWSKNEPNQTRISYGLGKMIEAVKGRCEYITAIPEDANERETFYNNLEKILRHIAFHVRSLSFQERVIPLEFLGRGGRNCAIRWQQEALNSYNYLTDESSDSPEEKVKAVIRSFLNQCYNDFTRKYGTRTVESDPHDRQAWLKLMGRELGIIGAELVQYSDPIGYGGLPPKEIALELFFREFFTSPKILAKVISHIIDVKARPKLSDSIGQLWRDKLSLLWAEKMTEESFNQIVHDYADKLKANPKQVAMVLAGRLQGILGSKEEWIRKNLETKVRRKKRRKILEKMETDIADLSKWAKEVTRSAFEKKVKEYSRMLKIKSAQVRVVMAKRIENELGTEIDGVVYKWLKDLLPPSKEEHEKVHRELYDQFTNEINDILFDDELNIKEEAVQEILVDLGIFHRST